VQRREVVINDLGPLTAREGEALLWVAEGKTAWEAGTILGISEATTNAHIASAAAKLNASNRAHLITRAFVAGILVPAAKLILLLSVLASACTGDLDEARMPRPGRRREDLCVVEKAGRSSKT
jgi:DNA-binding CsgD family transcriptional regulator